MLSNDADYKVALHALAEALAKFDAQDVYDELETESGVHLLHDLNVTIAQYCPALYAELEKKNAA